VIWRVVVNQLLSSLFEPPCAACKQRLAHPLDGAVCASCWTALRSTPHLFQASASSGLITSWCAVDHYEGRMKEIVHALKYERRRSIAAPLGTVMRECAKEMLRDADIVVPVPLHPLREYRRGFNQADDLAQHLGVPIARILRRARHTHSQIELPKQAREENVRGAFVLAETHDQPPAGCVAVLVDDVSTTGSTLAACARVLRAAGVREVRAVTAARVVSGRR
jgi:ComF family protein